MDIISRPPYIEKTLRSKGSIEFKGTVELRLNGPWRADLRVDTEWQGAGGIQANAFPHDISEQQSN